MESCPRKEVENFEEKLVEENFYLITEVLLLIRPFCSVIDPLFRRGLCDTATMHIACFCVSHST